MPIVKRKLQSSNGNNANGTTVNVTQNLSQFNNLVGLHCEVRLNGVGGAPVVQISQLINSVFAVNGGTQGLANNSINTISDSIYQSTSQIVQNGAAVVRGKFIQSDAFRFTLSGGNSGTYDYQIFGYFDEP